MSEPARSSRDRISLQDSDVRSRETAAERDEIELEPLQADKQEKQTDRPRYHRRAIFILLLYIPLIVLPWVLTCVMSNRPLDKSSYYDQHGLDDRDIARIEKWILAVSVLNSIASLITIPVLSALIAQATTVYSHKHTSHANFRLHYLIAFADRGWTDPLTLSKSLRWPRRGSNGPRSLLFFAALAVIIGSLQQPIYQILVPMESILIPTCHDTRYMDYQDRYRSCRNAALPAKVIGWDIEPDQMARTFEDDIFQKLINEFAAASLADVKPNMWNDTHKIDADPVTLESAGNGSFVATVAQGTSTGVLPQHVMRFNSSVHCEEIARSMFPASCSGENPFIREFSHGNNLTRVCVPGHRGTSPWNMSRSRQDIQEELFIDIFEELGIGTVKMAGFRNLTTDRTLHCTASTTRGYFELGNYRNNQTWGPLLAKWPSYEDLTNNFNDYLRGNLPAGRLGGPPSEFAPSTGNLTDLLYYASGPLTMTAIALFGNNTFFDVAIQAWNDSITEGAASMLTGERLCNIVPFARLEPPWSEREAEDPDVKFPKCTTGPRVTIYNLSGREFLSRWLHGFNATDLATSALTRAVLLVNEAVITSDKWIYRFANERSGRQSYGRNIYFGHGTTIHKPQVSRGVMVRMSCVLALELLCLAILAWLIYRGPSETATLDVMAFTRLKERMEEHSRPVT